MVSSKSSSLPEMIVKSLASGLILLCLSSQSAIAAIFDVELDLLNITNMSITRNSVLGEGWQQVSSGGFIPIYSLEETTEHIVTVTLPDSTQYDFGVKLEPESQALVPIQTTMVGFAPEPASAPEDLFSRENNEVWFVGSSLLDFNTFDAYDPYRFRFVDADGSDFDISRSSGLSRAIDVNDVVVLFSGDILTHTSQGATIGDYVRDRNGLLFEVGSPVVVPVPAAFWLLGSGLAGLIGMRKRKGAAKRLVA